MLNVLHREVRCFQTETAAPGWKPGPDVVWIDLLNPTRDEELAVEAALNVDLPTRDEMQALEPSSRFYQDRGATFMTATLLSHAEQDVPTASPVTFVLARGLLVTIRYSEFRAFTVFSDRAPESETPNGVEAMLGLLDAIEQRLSDILESMDGRVEDASAAIFRRPQGGNFRPMLTGLAQAQSVTALTRKSLVSLSRLLGYAALAPEFSGDAEGRAHLQTLQADVLSLTEQASFLSTHISFLLDAALGLINIEQNGIIKFFSVVAVVFLPPTLVASIYGMNFDHMPELHWMSGYPMALGLMVASAVLPILWFKQRGWL